MKFMKTQDKKTQISVYCIQHYCKQSFGIIKQLLPALATQSAQDEEKQNKNTTQIMCYRHHYVQTNRVRMDVNEHERLQTETQIE